MSENNVCACGAAPKLIFACSGAADVGAVADQAARKMTRNGAGKMYGKKIAIIAALVVAAGAIVFLKQGQKAVPLAGPEAKAGVEASAPQGSTLPRLVDLGAGKCIPCKAMKPILEELKVKYAGAFKTEFIDVWENPDAGKQYGINLIPTQIFFGADGKELFRHEGFFAKEDILAKWKELGVGSNERP